MMMAQVTGLLHTPRMDYQLLASTLAIPIIAGIWKQNQKVAHFLFSDPPSATLPPAHLPPFIPLKYMPNVALLKGTEQTLLMMCSDENSQRVEESIPDSATWVNCQQCLVPSGV